MDVVSNDGRGQARAVGRAIAGLAAIAVLTGSSHTERTWLGWLSGSIGTIVVVGLLYVLARWLRARREAGHD